MLMDEQRRTNLLLEEQGNVIRAILDYVKDVPKIKEDVGDTRARLKRVEDDVASVKLAVMDHSKRLTKLES